MSANFNITGRLHSGTATEQKTDTFSVRTFVLAIEDGQYTSYAQFQLVNKNTELLDRFKPNDTVTVTFNVNGRLWNSPDKGEMCFTTLNAWKMEYAQQAPAQPAQAWGTPQTSQDGECPF